MTLSEIKLLCVRWPFPRIKRDWHRWTRRRRSPRTRPRTTNSRFHLILLVKVGNKLTILWESWLSKIIYQYILWDKVASLTRIETFPKVTCWLCRINPSIFANVSPVYCRHFSPRTQPWITNLRFQASIVCARVTTRPQNRMVAVDDIVPGLVPFTNLHFFRSQNLCTLLKVDVFVPWLLTFY